MANKKRGFIPLYRDLQNHWIWQSDEPFTKGQAWVDLLLSVNHEDKKIFVNGKIVTIHAGQMWTSYKKLGNRWNWSKERVFRYAKLLKNDGMIKVDATANGTLITLINYEYFNNPCYTNKTANKTSGESTPKTADESTVETQTITINNINNYKQLKNNKSGDWQ